MHRVLYHMHIPKTAGTTLRTLIENEFAKAEVFPALLWRDVWETLGYEERPALNQRFKNSRKYRFVSGHFGYDIDRLFLSRSVRRFTMLREPSQRALSFYHHVRANPSITFYVSDEDQELHQLPNPVPDLSAVLSIPTSGRCSTTFRRDTSPLPTTLSRSSIATERCPITLLISASN